MKASLGPALEKEVKYIFLVEKGGLHQPQLAREQICQQLGAVI